MPLDAPSSPTPVSVAEVCRRFQPSAEARQLLDGDLKPGAYVARLAAAQLYPDALAFQAHRLSNEAVVWWGCLCAWEVCRPQPSEKEEEALRAAVRWLQEPNEDTRRAAEKAGQAAGLGTPSGAVALAAFWSTGSMAPAGLPEVAPPPYLPARTVTAALRLAAVLREPERQAERLRLFLQIGEEVARGKNRWE